MLQCNAYLILIKDLNTINFYQFSILNHNQNLTSDKIKCISLRIFLVLSGMEELTDNNNTTKDNNLSKTNKIIHRWDYF